MIIAIDYDGTWTTDPEGWRQFYQLMTRRGHRVVMVTGRSGWTADMGRGELPRDMEIIYTKGQLKEHYVRTHRAYKVDIWIDDMPGMIQECRILREQEDL